MIRSTRAPASTNVRMRLVLAACVVGIGVCARSPSAEACTCQLPPPRVLLPSASNLAPAAGPWLVVHSGDATVTLRTELGEEVPSETLRTFTSPSLCAWTFDLVRPSVPLEAGGYYRLAIAEDQESDERELKATERAPEIVERSLRVSLEHTVLDEELGCAQPEIELKHTKGWFQAQVEADAPALLFLELSAVDSSFGQLVSGNVSLDQGIASRFALSNRARADIPQLDTTADCARVVVRDALDAVVFDQEICPEPGKGVEATKTVSIPEHLVRESPVAEDQGCGCRAPRSNPAGLGALLLLGLGLLGRRLRTGTGSDSWSASRSRRRSAAATKRSSGSWTSDRTAGPRRWRSR